MQAHDLNLAFILLFTFMNAGKIVFFTVFNKIIFLLCFKSIFLNNITKSLMKIFSCIKEKSILMNYKKINFIAARMRNALNITKIS